MPLTNTYLNDKVWVFTLLTSLSALTFFCMFNFVGYNLTILQTRPFDLTASNHFKLKY